MENKTATPTTANIHDQFLLPKLLPTDFSPGNWDVICSKETDDHVGNRRFRLIIDMAMGKYSKASTKIEKTVIVSDIIDTINEKARATGYGGFVRQDPITGKWFEVGDKQARDKVGQTIRAALRKEACKAETIDLTTHTADVLPPKKRARKNSAKNDSKENLSLNNHSSHSQCSTHESKPCESLYSSESLPSNEPISISSLIGLQTRVHQRDRPWIRQVSDVDFPRSGAQKRQNVRNADDFDPLPLDDSSGRDSPAEYCDFEFWKRGTDVEISKVGAERNGGCLDDNDFDPLPLDALSRRDFDPGLCHLAASLLS